MNFNIIDGQQEWQNLLFRALAKDSLSHATLLTGPAGSGKKVWGRFLSMAILCLERQAGKPCMKCASCCSFHSGSHTQFFPLAPDGSKLKIDQIRSIRERFFLKGSKKVCLVEQAETMTAEAASSLLKILEEPPPGLYFILLAEKTTMLFDTIVSRCQRYSLQSLSSTTISELLLASKNVSAEKAALLARISGGLPGYAFEMAEDEHFESRLNEAQALVSSLASGCDSSRQLLSWALSLNEREDLVAFLGLLCMVIRDELLQKTAGRPLSLLGDVSSVRLEDSVMLINATIYELDNTNVNRRLLLEKALILLQRRLSQCQKSSAFDLSRPGRPTTLNPV